MFLTNTEQTLNIFHSLISDLVLNEGQILLKYFFSSGNKNVKQKNNYCFILINELIMIYLIKIRVRWDLNFNHFQDYFVNQNIKVINKKIIKTKI